MLAFVLVAWTAWREVTERWPRAERRVLLPLALTGLAVLSAVHVATGARGVTPREPDSAVVATLLPGVLGAVDPDGGQVLVTDPYHGAAYYSRAVVLELERAGVDARVAPERGVLFGQRRVVDEDEPVQAELVVVQDRGVDVFTENPDMRLVAKWEWSGAAVLRRNAERRADHLADLEGQPDRADRPGAPRRPPPPRHDHHPQRRQGRPGRRLPRPHLTLDPFCVRELPAETSFRVHRTDRRSQSPKR